MIELALYRRIQTTFWTDTKVVDDFTPEDKYFYLYLFTNPHTNLCGCYEISIKQMSNETGYSKDTVERMIDRFINIHKVVDYSIDTKELLLVNWHKYNWTKSPKYRKSLNEQISEVKNTDFKHYLEELYNSIDTVSIQYQYGIDTVTNTNSNAITILDKDEKREKQKKESDEIPDFDLEAAWKKTREMYPRNDGKGISKQLYLNVFKELSPLVWKDVANTISIAIKLYIKDCKERYGEEEKYIKGMDKWFKEDFDYYFDMADEVRKQRSEGSE